MYFQMESIYRQLVTEECFEEFRHFWYTMRTLEGLCQEDKCLACPKVIFVFNKKSISGSYIFWLNINLMILYILRKQVRIRCWYSKMTINSACMIALYATSFTFYLENISHYLYGIILQFYLFLSLFLN